MLYVDFIDGFWVVTDYEYNFIGEFKTQDAAISFAIKSSN